MGYKLGERGDCGFKRDGQASFLILASLLPAFVLFAFAINIGMLVHAKINLQNSADLAAYAGAAAQARQMTKISHLNYMMRMNYKKFLFLYYVMGNLGLRCFPGSPQASSFSCEPNPNTDFDFTNPAPSAEDAFPKAPSVCLLLNPRANICQLNTAATRNVAVPPLNCVPGESACATLNASLDRVRALQINDCGALGALNSRLAMTWLFNTDPHTTLPGVSRIEGLLQDTGLIPANIFLRNRIETIRKYVNEHGKLGVKSSTLSQLESATDTAKYERTILAFKTALGNLAGGTANGQSYGTFDAASLEMDELLPTNGSEASLLQLGTLHLPAPNFHVLFTYSGDNPMLSDSSQGSSADVSRCAVRLHAIEVPSQALPLGVYKSENSYVYYAVKLKAKAHLLFNPFPDLELTAYAAAAPFGSRIGPKLEPAQLIKDYRVEIDGRPQVVHIPDLEFGSGVYYRNAGLLKSYLQSSFSGSATEGGPTSTGSLEINTPKVLHGTELAMGPDPAELGKYNIPVHLVTASERVSSNPALLTSNNFFQYFSSPTSTYRFWAPYLSPGSEVMSQGDPAAQIRDLLDQIFGSGQTSVGGTNIQAVLRAKLQDSFDHYIASLSQPGGNPKDHHTKNTVAMINPLLHPDDLERISAQGGSLTKVKNPKALATSWIDTHLTPSEKAEAREGYSVKLISFRSLTNAAGRGPTSNIPGLGNGTFSPLRGGDFGQDAATDLPRLQY